MPYDPYRPEVDRDRLMVACVRKAFADPEQAGVFHGVKGGAVPLADWRTWILARAAEASRTILAYQASPLVIGVVVNGEPMPFSVDAKVTTPAGDHLVAFDIPELDTRELEFLLQLAAASCERRLVHVSDEDLESYVETGRFPRRSDAAPIFGPEGSVPPTHR